MGNRVPLISWLAAMEATVAAVVCGARQLGLAGRDRDHRLQTATKCHCCACSASASAVHDVRIVI